MLKMLSDSWYFNFTQNALASRGQYRRHLKKKITLHPQRNFEFF